MKLKIMGKTANDERETKASTSSGEASTSKTKFKFQGKKRKRSTSESSNDDQIILPDNALATERNVHISAVKNNLDETSVRKIIKKVVTNDHVLALVKLREEEEASSPDYKKLVPKLTRAKVKELKKVSTCKSAAWDLEKLELTPIKHIPVKTRPEVKALIAQELPEDEDDEEYEPTHDDIPSDDDHVESCSDLDSQPRTPATPAKTPSPKVVKDGPFKVPQDISKARRKLDIDEEEATIALRTRSKLSLSSTSIELIESTFVPPDDLPIQDVDDLWNDFLNECLNPASEGKHDDDDNDETLDDPEYNAAADPDAHDEDEEALSKSIIKISKKELNDLVTELFSILPEQDGEELVNTDLNENSVLTDNSHSIAPTFESKREPVSDDDTRQKPSKKLQFEKEISPDELKKSANVNNERKKGTEIVQSEKAGVKEKVSVPVVVVEKVPSEGQQVACSAVNGAQPIVISIQESKKEDTLESDIQKAPPSLREKLKPKTETVCIQIENNNVTLSKEQMLIFQQQMRQHIQLATSCFMQTVVHPVHWKLGPGYKEYLVSLMEIWRKNPNSVVNVCNLIPAYELIITWEKSVTEDTPENRKMIEFLMDDIEKSRRRVSNNNVYSGEFHDMFKKVVANSTVFLYPYLLPPFPFRPDPPKKFSYSYTEDTLMVLGIDQFWQYVDSNPELFKLKWIGKRSRSRPGYMMTLVLVCRHMFPWIQANRLNSHVSAVRASKDELNPIYRYFTYNEMPKIEHRILPFNPSLTLYEQPEYEMPRTWARYLAKTSQRFMKFVQRRSAATLALIPTGVKIDPKIPEPVRKPLPIAFTKPIVSSRSTLNERVERPNENRLDVEVQKVDPNQQQNKILVPHKFYRLVQTGTGSFLLPLQIAVDPSVDTTKLPLTPLEIKPAIPKIVPENQKQDPPPEYSEHCECCILLRKICKLRQTFITEYFKYEKKSCCCNTMTFPKITDRLKLLVTNTKKQSEVVFKKLERRIRYGEEDDADLDLSSKDMAYVLTYQVKVYTKASMCKRIKVKKRVTNLISHFDPVDGNPVKLAMDLFKAFGVELLDLYLDFLPFLTSEQAEKVAAFQDYFIRNCVQDLMKKIDELVKDNPTRLAILLVLKNTISGRLSACAMCAKLLRVMEGHKELAHYTFHLFPHTRENRPVITAPVEPLKPLPTSTSARSTSTAGPAQAANNQTDEATDTAGDEHHSTADYEADHSSRSSSDEDAMSVDLSRPPDPEVNLVANPGVPYTNPDVPDINPEVPDTNPQVPNTNRHVPDTNPHVPDTNSHVPDKNPQVPDKNPQVPVTNPHVPDTNSHVPDTNPHVPVTNPVCVNPGVPNVNPPSVAPSEEIQIYVKTEDSDSEHSLSIDETEVKQEIEDTIDWTKEEDRIILNVLQEHVTKEERKDRTIIDLLEEKNVYGVLFKNLDRTMCQIKERVLYILTLLVVSESDA